MSVMGLMSREFRRGGGHPVGPLTATTGGGCSKNVKEGAPFQHISTLLCLQIYTLVGKTTRMCGAFPHRNYDFNNHALQMRLQLCSATSILVYNRRARYSSYIAEYCCPVNFKTQKIGSSDIWSGAATTERPFSPVFDLASRSWIPPPAPTSAPSAPTSPPNAHALRARPAFFVICLHLFTTRP